MIAYYGDDSKEFSEITQASFHAFRTKGGKYQILQKLVQQNPQFFDQYSYVWVCDDDIQMSAAQIDEAFAIAEFYNFWIAQPAFLPEGKYSSPITLYRGSQFDYRMVNFIENGVAIFRRDKLTQFLQVYDGSLAGGYGIDYWYLTFFKANEFRRFTNIFRASDLGRFAIIDRVPVINPCDEEKKGGREVDRLQTEQQGKAEWDKVRAKFRLAEFHHKVFASCTIASHRRPGTAVTTFDLMRQIASDVYRKTTEAYAKFRILGWNALMDLRFRLFPGRSRKRILVSGQSTALRSNRQTLAETLGYSSDARLLIVHADDFAMAHSVNAAIIRGLRMGRISSASVMVPCPWFPEVVAFARTNPKADLGIHLTLTSEPAAYRFRPTAPTAKVPSLIDREGFFPDSWTKDTRVNVREVEIELRAQIEHAYASGLRPTHLDSHQYRLQMCGRRLFEVYVRLGREYGLPIFVARNWFTEFPYLQDSLNFRDTAIDHTFTIGPDITPKKWSAFYRHAIERLRPGITQAVIHPGLDDSELRAFYRGRTAYGASWRQRELDFFTSEKFQALLVKENIKLITWREIGAGINSKAE